MNTINWQKAGDLIHFLSICNTALFAYAVVSHGGSRMIAADLITFDPKWLQDGFCVSGKDTPFYNSHDLSLYVDVVGSTILGLLYLISQGTPGMDVANKFAKVNILGIFGHGVGHGLISRNYATSMQGNDSGIVGEEDVIISPAPQEEDGILPLVMILFFWVALLKSCMPDRSYQIIIPMAIISTVMMNNLPGDRFAFTFVQTVLMFAYSFDQVMKPKKEKDDIQYFLYPFIVSFPLSFISWIESTQCTSFVLDLGGHVIYDGYIVISIIFFYILCLLRTSYVKRKDYELSSNIKKNI